MRADLYRHLFEASPHCDLVLAPDLTIVAVTDAYLRATMTRRDDIVGHHLFEVFPGDPADPSASDLRASLERVLSRRAADRTPVRTRDVRRPAEEGGGFEERHWLAVNTPILGADGSVELIVHQVEDVTENRRTEATLLDAAPDAMLLVGPDGRIERVNAQAERLFGYARHELVGEALERLVPEASRGAHAGHLRRFFEDPAALSMGSGIELFGRRKDGSRLPIEVTLGPVRTARGLAVFAAVRDVSERRRLAEAAARMAQRLTSAVESMDEAFALFDDVGALVLCNNPFRGLLGDDVALAASTYGELLDLFAANLAFAGEEERASFREARLADRSEPLPAPFDARTLDGRSLRVATRRTLGGGLLLTFSDWTAEERRSEELGRAHALAAAGSAAKTEFLSSMSHELRTPLNAVLGFAQLLERDRKQPLTERQHDRVRRILSGGEQLLRLVDDVLDLARIEEGRVAISVEPVSVGEVLEDVKRTLEPMATRYGLSIAIEPRVVELPLLEVDRLRFAQIVTNFCSNALKYNRPGGTVRVSARATSAARVRVTVTDTGLGIPLSKQALLFQPFQRAGQETGPIEGTGIGLVITRKLATLMNGEVGFASAEGEGSSFWVDVPVRAAEGSDRGPGGASSFSGARDP